MCACLGASALVVRGNRIYFMETRHRYMLRHQPTNCWLNLRKGKYTVRKLFHRSTVVDSVKRVFMGYFDYFNICLIFHFRRLFTIFPFMG